MKNPGAGFQHTIGDRVEFSGIGVHRGKPTSMAIMPADPDTGIVFLRGDLDTRREIEISATLDSIGATELCTVLGDPNDLFVATVEHLLAALSGLEIDNALVEIDAAEIPVLDGSAAPFADAVSAVGRVMQSTPRRFIRVANPVRVALGDSYAEFTPSNSREFDIAIDYACRSIGKQSIELALTPESFKSDVARARTFGFMDDVERLWKAGFALGSSLENTVVISDDRVMNMEGLRFENEFVRHKLLDAIGDLALAGLPILGRYKSYKGGHRLNSMAVAALLANTESYEIVTFADFISTGEARGELAPGIAVPAFAPERS